MTTESKIVTIRGVEIDKNHFSWSRISKYLVCSLKYWWHYVQGEKEPSNANLILGNSCHSTAEFDYSVKIATGSNEPLSVKQDFFLGVLKEAMTAPDVVLESGETFESLSKLGLQMISAHHIDRALRCRPLAVEKGLITRIPGVEEPFLLFIDLIEAIGDNERGIIDLQTSKSKYQMHDAALSTQPALGSHATGIMNVGYDVLTKSVSRPEYQPVHDTLEQSVRDYSLEKMARVVNAIKADVFIPPEPGEWPCTPSCHYWKKCAGKHIPVSVFAATEKEKADKKAAKDADKAAKAASKPAKKASRTVKITTVISTEDQPTEEASPGTPEG